MTSRWNVFVLLALCWPAQGWAQTRVDLRTQSRSIDFSSASSTKPMKTGDILPSTCEAGEMFLLLSAQPGGNLYACTAANTWTLQGAIEPSGSYSASFSASTQVTLTHDLETEDVLAACYDNGTPRQQVEWNRLEVTSANQVTVYFQQPQSGHCVVLSAAGTATSQGSALSVVGIGLSVNDGIVSVDTAVVPMFVTVAASLDFAAIAGGSCQSLTLGVQGVSQSDGIAPGWPPTLEDGLTGVMLANSGNSVTVRLCNITASPIDPINQTFRATIVRSF